MDETSTKHLGQLRRRAHELALEVQRLEAQVSHLEKELSLTFEDGPIGKRLGEVQLKLDHTRAELEHLTDEIEAIEHSREVRAEYTCTGEIDHLVDSFEDVAAQAPELSRILEAMKLAVGALATCRRLQIAHEELTEPKEISAALLAALQLLAETLSTAKGRAGAGL